MRTMSNLFMSTQRGHCAQKETAEEDDDEPSSSDDTDELQEGLESELLPNLISLQLRKPSHWNWELTTSRSSSHIVLPRILLYDHTGALLVDAVGQTEQSYRPPPPPAGTSSTEQQTPLSRRRIATRRRAATTNLTDTVRQALHKDFNALQIAEATPTPRTTPTRKPHSGSCIDISTHELPDYKQRTAAERSSSSLRSVCFQDVLVWNPCATDSLPYPTPPSTSTLTTTANSSSSEPREKRSHRRSHSFSRLASGSILERFSMSKGRHSSPEYAEYVVQQLPQPPRYYMRSSKAGTLVIQDDSFNRVRHRRSRPRHSSSENVLRESAALPAASQRTACKRSCSQRRQRSSMALTLNTSEEETEKHQEQRVRFRRPQRNFGKDVKQESISVDPENYVFRAGPDAMTR